MHTSSSAGLRLRGKRASNPIRLIQVSIALLVITSLVLLGGPVAALPGDLDPTFDGDGKTTTDFGLDTIDGGRAVAIQTDGRIVVAGQGDYQFGVARYNSDGSLDASFAGDGTSTVDMGNASMANAV
ncbi:MAG: hypothetical protein E6G40_12420, partial [Actinobacteria bacterium]